MKKTIVSLGFLYLTVSTNAFAMKTPEDQQTTTATSLLTQNKDVSGTKNKGSGKSCCLLTRLYLTLCCTNVSNCIDCCVESAPSIVSSSDSSRD